MRAEPRLPQVEAEVFTEYFWPLKVCIESRLGRTLSVRTDEGDHR
jgi:hypothetical protein